MSFFNAIGSISAPSPEKKTGPTGALSASKTDASNFINLFSTLGNNKPKGIPNVSAGITMAENISVANTQDGNVSSVKLGDDKYVTKTALLNIFDSGQKDGVVSTAEFESKKNSVDWSTVQTVTIQFLKDDTLDVATDSETLLLKPAIIQEQAINMTIDCFDKAENYLKAIGLPMTYPSSIILGNNGKGDYSTPEGKWNISNVTPEVLMSKIFQTALINKYPNLGYTGLETFARYFTNDCMIKNGIPGRNGMPGITPPPSLSTKNPDQYIYKPELAGLTGNNISHAYSQGIIGSEMNKIIDMVSNNNISIYLAIKDLSPQTIKSAMDRLSRVKTPTGLAIANAVFYADKALGGTNQAKIVSSFAEHGISVREEKQAGFLKSQSSG